MGKKKKAIKVSLPIEEERKRYAALCSQLEDPNWAPSFAEYLADRALESAGRRWKMNGGRGANSKARP